MLINCYWKCKSAYPQHYTTTEVALVKEDLLEEVGFKPGLKETYGLGGAEEAKRSEWRETEASEKLLGSLTHDAFPPSSKSAG